jgi:hypothetical protein
MRLFRFRFLVSTIQIVGVTVLVAGILTWALLARQTAPSTSAAAGAGTVSTVPAAVQPAAAAVTIVDTRDPQADIQLRMSKATGNDCFVTALPLRILASDAELEKAIAKAGGDNRWLTAGSSWVGTDPSAAVNAFGAVWAGKRTNAPAEVWIQVAGKGDIVGIQLVARTTSAGHTVWSAADTLMAANTCD